MCVKNLLDGNLRMWMNNWACCLLDSTCLSTTPHAVSCVANSAQFSLPPKPPLSLSLSLSLSELASGTFQVVRNTAGIQTEGGTF